MIKCTKNPKDAVITHGGCFHADDVMATVILSKIYEYSDRELFVCRVCEVPPNLEGQIIYDIGLGQYDHHQRGGNGTRENGVPYAACGLIWKAFGRNVVKNFLLKKGMYEDENVIYVIWKKIDKGLIQGIDAFDNGKIPHSDYPTQNMNISQILSSFNPNWDSKETSDERFIKACEFAETIFDILLEKSLSEIQAKDFIENAIEKSHGHIMVLDKYAPWTKYIFSSKNAKAKDIFFVIYPSSRGVYNWQCVPTTPGGHIYRKPVPNEWQGVDEKKLKKITGVTTAKFCHPAGYIGNAVTLEDAIKLAKIAIES